MSIFSKFFETEDTNVESDISECHQIVSWAREPYFDRFLAYLERGAEAKIDTSTATSMLASAERINTFKDIRAHLKKQLRDAEAIIERENRNE